MTLPVGDFSSSKSNKEKSGKVFVVDPNPPGMEVVPPEDLFIYVKFSAYPRSRTTYGGTLEGDAVLFKSGVEDEVNFISTRISYKEGKLDPNPQQTYATTDWTEIGGFKRSDTRSSGILEGFGIKSIDIKYNASLVPVVDITFTDVRGSALFDVIESDDRKTPYSLFFKMPYPVFKLSVKGYFGQKVDYCLHMVNWTSNFDGSTGNFDISANFLGFQQAFLNDMVIGNVIGTINTPQGRANLDEIYDRRIRNGNQSIPSNGGEDLRQLDDFLTKIAKIQIDSEIIKSDNNNFDVLKSLNGKLKLLKSIRGFIGPALPKQPISNGSDNKKQKEYLDRENFYTRFDTSSITDDELKINQNYLSIRDFIVFKSINTSAFKSYINTLSKIIQEYLDYVKSVGGKTFVPPANSAERLKNNELSKGLSDGLYEKYDGAIDQAFPNRTDTEKDWISYIHPFTMDTNSKPDNKKLFDVLNAFINGDGNTQNFIQLTTNYPKGNQSVNNGMKIDKFKDEVLVSADGKTGGKYYKNPYKFKSDSNVFVVDFREQRAVIEDAIQKLENSIKFLRDEVQQELNEEILANFEKEFKFRPTIDKCFEILANNTQAMVETIWDISDAAEKIGEERQSELKGYETDIVQGAKEVAWQSVYQKDTDGSLKEIYIGEAGVDPNKFPELKFVEDVFKILVTKSKNIAEISRTALQTNSLDSDNWFPINPIDYETNPWIRLNKVNSEKELGEELSKNIFLRLALLLYYSNFDQKTGLSNSVNDYASLEGIAMNKTIISDNTRSIIGNLLNEISQNQLLGNVSNNDKNKFNLKNSDFWNDYVEVLSSSEIRLKEDFPLEIGNFQISGKYPNNVDYILFDDTNIINNSKKLFTEIKENLIYSTQITDRNKNNLFGESKGAPYIYKNLYINNNLTTYNSYNVWDESIGINIVKSKGNEVQNNLKAVPLNVFNPSASTLDSKYFNIPYFNFKLPTNFGTGCNFGDTMIESNLYKGNDKYARALLLLSTFPFRTFEEGFLKSVFTPSVDYSGARIVNLPNLYVYYIGGLLMRYEDELSINFNVAASGCSTTYITFDAGKDSYLNLGYQRLIANGGSVPKLEDSLIYLPDSVKRTLINKFKLWVDQDRFNTGLNGFFELRMKYLVPSLLDVGITPQNKKDGGNYILKEILSVTDLIILNPFIFNPTFTDSLQVDGGFKLDLNLIQSYINTIKEDFVFTEIERNKKPDPPTELDDIKKQTLEKLQIYNYFKNINNKWVGGDRRAFNICGGGDKDLIEYFKFIDRGWRNIGSEATFNLNSFLTLGSNLNTSMYFFMSKLLRDSNFLFQILPTYINYKDSKEVAKIFQPQTQLEVNSESGPIFCCIYVGGASEVLDISERSNYYFKNDGFRFPNPNDPNDKGDLPADMVGPDDSSLVAFRVAFGAQNQTIFKNVSLSQQEHKETGEYFRALGELVDKRGGTQKTYVGTDLLRLFKTRSYTCKVDALGCMNIQPLMYFDLQNVPFFNGAYLVTSVNHNISPNHMTTNFQGVRQSKFISPPTDKITAELDIDLNESGNIPKLEFTNLQDTNGLYTIGVLNPTDQFEFVTNFRGDNNDYEIGVQKFRNLGVTSGTLSDDKLKELIIEMDGLLNAQNIKTNSQVTTFIASILSNSDNFISKEMPWEVNPLDNYAYKPNGKYQYYANTSLGSFPDPIIVDQQDTYLSSVPLFTADTSNDNTAYYPVPNNEDLDEVRENTAIEREKTILQRQIANLDTNDANYTKNSNALNKKIDELKKREKNLVKTTLYYNILEGDAYRFRPRGYLYVIGRKQYFDLYGKNFIQKPNLASDTEIDALGTSVKVWKNYSGTSKTTAYAVSNTGTASSFALCVDISQQYKSPGKEVAFNTFENVLNEFTLKDGTPLIDYNNP